MEEQQRPSQGPPPLPAAPRVYPLDYARPDPDRPAGNVPFALQLVLGCLAYFAAGAAGLIAVAISGDASVGLVGLAAGLVSLFVMIGIARTRWHWKGFAMGVLLGVGLTALTSGLCMVAFSR